MSAARSVPLGATGEVAVTVAALLSGTLGLVVTSPTVVVCAILVAAVGPVQVERIGHRRRREQALGELPNLVDILLVDIRAGAGFREALIQLDRATELYGARQLVSPLTDSLAAGLPLNQSISTLTTHREPSLRLFGAGLHALATTGGPTTQALQHLRHTLMASAHARKEVGVHASQARASASVLSLAPLMFAFLAALADARLANFYLFSWPGAICVVASAGLTGCGWRWMMFLTDGDGES